MKLIHFFLPIVAGPIFCTSQAGTVTTSADSGPGSLRNAVANAASNETIDFAPALNGVTITLASAFAVSGKIFAIDASALPAGLRISGNNTSRIFDISSGSKITLRSLTLVDGFQNNGNGGGMSVVQSEIHLAECSIINCRTNFDGGGFWGNSVSGSIIRCKLTGNRSENIGGGLFVIGSSSLEISNSQISGNIAPIGGGIYSFASSPVVTNCVVQGNFGKGIMGDTNSQVVVKNSIVWGNRGPGTFSVADFQLSNSKSTVSAIPDSTTTVSNSLIEGASGASSFSSDNTVIWGAANLNGTLPANDPRFVNAAPASAAPISTSDLRVFQGSPVVDVGDNGSNSQVTDLAGMPRIQNAIIDLGPYEGGYVTFSLLYPTLVGTGDANGNGLSNFADYALGYDPTANTFTSGASIYTSAAGFQFVTFTKRTNGTDIVSEWQTSTLLTPGDWVPMIAGLHYTFDHSELEAPVRERVTLRLIPLGPIRFYRQALSRTN